MGDGLTSLPWGEVGKETSFLDMSEALKLGLLGAEPPSIWRDKQWSEMISFVVSGLSFKMGGWDDLEYCEQAWATAETSRTRATKSQLGRHQGLEGLEREPRRVQQLPSRTTEFLGC